MRRKNQRGQMMVEMILLMAVMAGLAAFVTSELQSRKFLSNVVAAPWSMLSGMIECGVWKPCGPGLHPMARDRNLSLDPKK